MPAVILLAAAFFIGALLIPPWVFMLLLGAVHHGAIPAGPALGFWPSALLLWLISLPIAYGVQAGRSGGND